jgi:hypothetical protein
MLCVREGERQEMVMQESERDTGAKEPQWGGREWRESERNGDTRENERDTMVRETMRVRDGPERHFF